MRRGPVAIATLAALALVASAAPAFAKPGHVPAHRADNMPRGFAWPPTALMVAAGKQCERQLDELGVTRSAAKAEGHMVEPVAIAPAGDAHRFALGGVTYVGVNGGGPYAMDCQLAAALAGFGGELAALGAREIHFASIYRWSKVRVGGKTKNLLSRHALGLAMDVVSVVDADGHELVVARDYLREPKTGGPLHAIEQAVNHSGHFRMVLTPANDPLSHHDHFHFEADVDYSKPTT